MNLLITTLLIVAMVVLTYIIAPKHTFLGRLVTPLILLIIAVAIGVVLIPISFTYQLGASLVKFRFKFFKDIIKFIGELFYAIFWFFGQLAVGIDLIGNVCGELIEDSVTSTENTHFGESKMTISGSLGHLELNNKLDTDFGKWLTKKINAIFNEGGEGHCINSYRYWIERRKQK